MFLYCLTLTYLNIRNFKIENFIDMNHMFENCLKLTKLNLNNFNIESVIIGVEFLIII